MHHSFFSLMGLGTLTIKAAMSGPVEVYVNALDGSLPSLLRVTGDSQLIKVAYGKQMVELEIFGFKFRTRIRSQLAGLPVIFVDSEPMFLAMSKHLKTRRAQ